jgi:hypothetical protein
MCWKEMEHIMKKRVNPESNPQERREKENALRNEKNVTAISC